MDTDWQRIAEQPRLTPARETLKSSNPTHAPAPSYFSFCPGGFIVATAVFRFNQRNPLFPGTQWRIGFKNLLTGGIRCQELRSQSGTKPGNLRHGKVGVCHEVWTPGDAARMIRNLAKRVQAHDLTPEQTLTALDDAQRQGVSGRMVHDWLHARAAKLTGADVVLTRNGSLSRLCAAEGLEAQWP